MSFPNIIPDKNLIIVTSALKPLGGPFSDGERFQQTIDGLRSIRKVIPDTIIVFVDVSVRPLTDLEKTSIAEKSNYFIDMSQDKTVLDLSNRGLKSLAENVMMFNTLQTLRRNTETAKMLSSVIRIFKISARTVVKDTFNMWDYKDVFGKFIFKKRIPTWMNPPVVSDLLITRMFCFCPSLIEAYIRIIQDNVTLIQQGLDTEHAHFATIPKHY